jgi:5-methyltetrahydrofolate--homocysteine methyltransferase
VHTAVKIAPHYDGPVVYVPDASRSVSVAQSLLGDQALRKYMAEVNADYDKVRHQHANKKQTPLWPSDQGACQQDPVVNWSRLPAAAPKFIGRRVFKNFDLGELARYIDWGPFFQTWDLAGPYPAILTDEVVGDEAAACLADGSHAEKNHRWPLAHRQRRHGLLYPANSVNDDDIELYTDESRSQVA